MIYDVDAFAFVGLLMGAFSLSLVIGFVLGFIAGKIK